MKLQELKAMADRTESQGLNRIILVIQRKSKPKGWKVRVKGMGLGEIANVQEKDGRIDVVAWFHLKDVRRYIGLIEASINDPNNEELGDE